MLLWEGQGCKHLLLTTLVQNKTLDKTLKFVASLPAEGPKIGELMASSSESGLSVSWSLLSQLSEGAMVF